MFNLEGTTTEISGNTAANGGGVYIESGTLIFDGGIISGNTAAIGNGGGVFVGDSASLRGTISNNEAAQNGGGVFIASSSTSVDRILSGTINGNRASVGGGVFVGTNNIPVILAGGATRIRENILTGTTTASNLHLSNDSFLTIEPLGYGDLLPGSEIHVQTDTPSGLIMQSGANATIASYFHPDISGQFTQLEGEQIFVRLPSQGFTFVIEPLPGSPPTLTPGIILSQSGNGHPTSASLEIASVYTNIEWLFGVDDDVLGTSHTLVLDVSIPGRPYNIVGTWELYVGAWQAGVYFGANVLFTVLP
jgi:hypothetical protein